MEKVVISTSKTENGFSASCELLPGWIVTYTGNFSDFVGYVQESIDFYIECAKEDGDEYPFVFDGDYEFSFSMSVQSLLYCYEKILSRALLSRLTGINEKQLGHYICGRSKPRQAQTDKIVNALHSLGRELQSVTV